MAIRFIIRWLLPLLVVLTIVIALALVATGAAGAHAAGVTPDAYWHW
jgi:hypothetical protein